MPGGGWDHVPHQMLSGLHEKEMPSSSKLKRVHATGLLSTSYEKKRNAEFLKVKKAQPCRPCQHFSGLIGILTLTGGCDSQAAALLADLCVPSTWTKPGLH